MAKTTEKPAKSILALRKVSVNVFSRSLIRINLSIFIVPKNNTNANIIVPPSSNVAATWNLMYVFPCVSYDYHNF